MTLEKPLIEQRADPYVLFHEGWYYFTASVPEYDRIELRKARTVQGLASAAPVSVWHRHESGPQSWNVWAPEIHFIDGAWYIYYASGEKDDVWKIRPYVLECRESDPLTGKWTELGMLQAAPEDPFSFTDFSLDATTFVNRGHRYLIWAQKVSGVGGISNLYIARLAAPNRLATVQVQLTTPDYDWERIGFWVNEGPAVIHRNGRIWVTFSASATGACYCMGLLSASEDADLLDPSSWKKEKQPVFTTQEEIQLYGPGHNSFTVSEDGKTDILVFHARTYEKITGDPLYDPNRHTFLRPINWKDDGSPCFN